jgi:hypothetical protein
MALQMIFQSINLIVKNYNLANIKLIFNEGLENTGSADNIEQFIVLQKSPVRKIFVREKLIKRSVKGCGCSKRL